MAGTFSKIWKIILGILLALAGVVFLVGWFDSFLVLLKGAVGPALILFGISFFIIALME